MSTQQVSHFAKGSTVWHASNDGVFSAKVVSVPKSLAGRTVRVDRPLGQRGKSVSRDLQVSDTKAEAVSFFLEESAARVAQLEEQLASARESLARASELVGDTLDAAFPE